MLWQIGMAFAHCRSLQQGLAEAMQIYLFYIYIYIERESMDEGLF